jgi:hypothetical protein
MKFWSIAVLLLCCGPLCARFTTAQLTLAVGASAAQPSLALDAREGFMPTWQERSAATAMLRAESREA